MATSPTPPTTAPADEPLARRSRCWAALSRLLPVVNARRDGTLAVPMAVAVGTALDEFLASGWREWDTEHRLAASRRPDRDRRLIMAAAQGGARTLSSVVTPPAVSTGGGPADPRPIPPLRRAVAGAALIGERLFAMHLAKEPLENVDIVRGLLEGLARNAYFAAAAQGAAFHFGLAPRDSAPAFWAALLAYTHPETNPTPAAALARHGLTEGSPIPSDVLARWADTILTDLLAADERMLPPMTQADALGRLVARPQKGRSAAQASWDALPQGLQRLVQHHVLGHAPNEQTPAKLQLTELLRHAAVAHGDNPAAWVEGACHLLDCVLTVGAMRASAAEVARLDPGPDRRPTSPREPLLHLHAALDWLPRLSCIASGERQAAYDAERRWREIEAELRRMQERAREGDPPPQYAFPETMSEIEGRGLFYFEATRRGIPLGAFLHELAHDPELTFGPSEGQFFTRILFAGARRFAAELAAEEDPRIDSLADIAVGADAVRVSHVRGVLARIERALRLAPADADAPALQALGQALFQEALTNGDLRRAEANRLWAAYPGVGGIGEISGSIVDAMIAKIYAMRELDLLTGLLAVEGSVPAEYIAHATDLAYVAHAARIGGPQTILRRLPARNGQLLADLERTTRARWMRYRLDAPPGLDVRPIEPAAGDDEIGSVLNPLGLRGKRPFQQRSWSDMAQPGGGKPVPGDRRGPKPGGPPRR